MALPFFKKPKGAVVDKGKVEITNPNVAGFVKEVGAQEREKAGEAAKEAAATPAAKGPDDDIFYIDTTPKLIKIPPFSDKQKINVRYPLLPPYAFAHIFWDMKNNELVYHLEEPLLDETETELLELIQLGLEEMINISYVRAAKKDVLLHYLERNVKNILVELGAKVSRKTYNKIMYYVYRDSIGLNEIEPLLNDYYIEDIECNGSNFPLYIVHRKYENLKTNVIFTDPKHLSDFVEKMAQKTGRYVSYAKPLLDGTLPDGSRINATYSDDVTTRGPTFTIRKFTKEPWTPINLIKQGTGNPQVFAFLWLVVEHKFNMMTVGETASGKTTFLNAVLCFIPPEARICSIEDTREINIYHDNWLPAVTRAGFGITNIMGQQYGEITLFDLLRETFRQNPDYVVVGETRGAEASVLFQGMASGHPSYTTFHAASVETVVRRLETPPINLSPSLIEALDIVVICTHVKTQEKNLRRVTEIDEIINVEAGVGKVNKNAVFLWNAQTDKIQMNANSHILKRIIERAGTSMDNVRKELMRRTKLLTYLLKNDMAYYKDFKVIVNDYYKDPAAVMKRYGLE